MGELNHPPVAILASEMTRKGGELPSVAVHRDAPCHPPHEVPGFPARIGGPEEVLGHALRNLEDPIEQAPRKKKIGVGADPMIPGDRLRDPSLHPLPLHDDDRGRKGGGPRTVQPFGQSCEQVFGAVAAFDVKQALA